MLWKIFPHCTAGCYSRTPVCFSHHCHQGSLHSPSPWLSGHCRGVSLRGTHSGYSRSYHRRQRQVSSHGLCIRKWAHTIKPEAPHFILSNSSSSPSWCEPMFIHLIHLCVILFSKGQESSGHNCHLFTVGGWSGAVMYSNAIQWFPKSGYSTHEERWDPYLHQLLLCKPCPQVILDWLIKRPTTWAKGRVWAKVPKPGGRRKEVAMG